MNKGAAFVQWLRAYPEAARDVVNDMEGCRTLYAVVADMRAAGACDEAWNQLLSALATYPGEVLPLRKVMFFNHPQNPCVQLAVEEWSRMFEGSQLLPWPDMLPESEYLRAAEIIRHLPPDQFGESVVEDLKYHPVDRAALYGEWLREGSF